MIGSIEPEDRKERHGLKAKKGNENTRQRQCLTALYERRTAQLEVAGRARFAAVGCCFPAGHMLEPGAARHSKWRNCQQLLEASWATTTLTALCCCKWQAVQSPAVCRPVRATCGPAASAERAGLALGTGGVGEGIARLGLLPSRAGLDSVQLAAAACTVTQ